MIRLFVGLEIPQAVAMRLSLLAGGLEGARWIEASDYHVTLRFIGDIEEPMAEEVDAALSGIDRPRFRFEIDRLDSFGGRKPHALIAAIRNTKPLQDLHDELERTMQRIGLRPETRKFSPHITIARLRGQTPASVAAWLAMRQPFAAEPIAADGFALYSAKASTGGGPYVVERRYPLR